MKRTGSTLPFQVCCRCHWCTVSRCRQQLRCGCVESSQVNLCSVCDTHPCAARSTVANPDEWIQASHPPVIAAQIT